MQAIPDNLDYSQAEHICLEADRHTEQIDTTSRSAEYRLALKRPSHGVEQTVTLYDDGSLSIEERNRKTRRRYSLYARFVDACPEVTRHIARRAFIVAGITAALALGLLALPVSLGVLDPWRLTAGILLATTSLFALLLAIYRTGDTLCFASRHGRVPVLTIKGGIRCQRRCAQLIQKLAAVSEAPQAGDTNSLRDEMRDHHRLKSEGIIDAIAYEAAKLRILSAHN